MSDWADEKARELVEVLIGPVRAKCQTNCDHIAAALREAKARGAEEERKAIVEWLREESAACFNCADTERTPGSHHDDAAKCIECGDHHPAPVCAECEECGLTNGHKLQCETGGYEPRSFPARAVPPADGGACGACGGTRRVKISGPHGVDYDDCRECTGRRGEGEKR